MGCPGPGWGWGVPPSFPVLLSSPLSPSVPCPPSRADPSPPPSQASPHHSPLSQAALPGHEKWLRGIKMFPSDEHICRRYVRDPGAGAGRSLQKVVFPPFFPSLPAPSSSPHPTLLTYWKSNKYWADRPFSQLQSLPVSELNN